MVSLTWLKHNGINRHEAAAIIGFWRMGVDINVSAMIIGINNWQVDFIINSYKEHLEDVS